MILTLYGFLIFVSLVMITIGLAKPSESAQALVGFFLMFVLSLVIIGGDLEIEMGSQINTTYYYDASGMVNFTSQEVAHVYENFVDQPGENTAHWIGYYMAIAAAVGFGGVLYSLRKSKKMEE